METFEEEFLAMEDIFSIANNTIPIDLETTDNSVYLITEDYTCVAELSSNLKLPTSWSFFDYLVNLRNLGFLIGTNASQFSNFSYHQVTSWRAKRALWKY